MIPQNILREAEAAFDWSRSKTDPPEDFLAGVHWLFTRLLEMSEGEFDEKAADIDSEGYEHNVYTADPDGVASHPAKHWVDGRRWQHALSQAALLKAREEIASLKHSYDDLHAYMEKRGVELFKLRAKCERLERALKEIAHVPPGVEVCAENAIARRALEEAAE